MQQDGLHSAAPTCFRTNSGKLLDLAAVVQPAASADEPANDPSDASLLTLSSIASSSSTALAMAAAAAAAAPAPLALNVYFATWNVNGKACKEDLAPWLAVPPDSHVKPDLYVLGFQEFDLTAESFVTVDQSRLQQWKTAIEAALKPVGTYTQVAECQLVGMLVLLFGTPEFCSHITDIDTAMIGCGYTGVMGNKGAVGVRLVVGGNGQPGTGRSLCFINCHLNAHVHNVKRRQEDFQAIVQKLVFFAKSPPVIPPPTDLAAVRDMMKHEEDAGGSLPELGAVGLRLGPEEPAQLPAASVQGLRLLDHDIVFWFGDLNYRVELPREEIFGAIARKDWAHLLEADQLRREMQVRHAFQGFFEAPIEFQPSYKFDSGTDNFDSSPKNRLPAYCDRVLWRVARNREHHHDHAFYGCGKRLDQCAVPAVTQDDLSRDGLTTLEPLSDSAVTPLSYRVHMELRVSDHKPVSALLRVDLGSVIYPSEAVAASEKQRKARVQKSLPVTNVAKGGYMTNEARARTSSLLSDYGVYIALIAAVAVAYLWLR